MDGGDGAMVTLDDALQDRNMMMLVVWAAMNKKDTNDDPCLRFLKEMGGHLHFRKENIEGMLLLGAVRRAAV